MPPLAAQIIGLLQLAFTIWMMVDAYHRSVEQFWYWIILLFQPIGAWAYFFSIKLHTLRMPGMRRSSSWRRSASSPAWCPARCTG